MKNKAFTLIELLVVISIISIIAALILPAMQNAQNKANGNPRYKSREELLQELSTIEREAIDFGYAEYDKNSNEWHWKKNNHN